MKSYKIDFLLKPVKLGRKQKQKINTMNEYNMVKNMVDINPSI